MKKIIIGITGGIASGKSEIRRELESLGCLGIDADRISHEVLEPNTSVSEEVLRHCGSRILSDRNIRKIDRNKLGEIVFENHNELEWLESITHPEIINRITQIISGTDRSVALEAIKLNDSGLSPLCDQKWLVETDPEIQTNRLMRKRGLSRENALIRIRMQQNMNWHRDEMDHIFNGGIPLEDLKAEVRKVWNVLQTD
mgnify:CR=1 FL=1